MTTIAKVATAFAKGNDAKCHNAVTDGVMYRLHNTVIAVKVAGGVMINWGRWYTPTTANHVNHVLSALGIHKRVSYAASRDNGDREVFFAA